MLRAGPHSMVGVPETTDPELQYHVLPNADPVTVLNALRQAAGLEPWTPDDAD